MWSSPSARNASAFVIATSWARLSGNLTHSTARHTQVLALCFALCQPHPLCPTLSMLSSTVYRYEDRSYSTGQNKAGRFAAVTLFPNFGLPVFLSNLSRCLDLSFYRAAPGVSATYLVLRVSWVRLSTSIAAGGTGHRCRQAPKLFSWLRSDKYLQAGQGRAGQEAGRRAKGMTQDVSMVLTCSVTVTGCVSMPCCGVAGACEIAIGAYAGVTARRVSLLLPAGCLGVLVTGWQQLLT